MATPLPVSSLLSQVLVAFTIEFDNEFEHRTPHRTTRFAGSRAGPWLVSMVMYSNLMRCVREEGVAVTELQNLAGVKKLSLAGMERWGYIVVDRDRVIRPTAKGRMALEVWRPLFGVIEKRWRERFGKNEIGRVRESLSALVSQIDVALPEYPPVVGFGLFTGPVTGTPAGGVAAGANLPALLSKVLLAFTLDFERQWDLSLAISANILRILSEAGVRVRDLARLSGVSKEAIQTSLGYLEKRRYVTVETDAAPSRTRMVRLTSTGRLAQDAYRQRLGMIEERWKSRFGQDNIASLREALRGLAGEPEQSPLFRGLEPYPDGWRAAVPKPATLPHHPMVLHRGGFPDGS
jgi:DNA-binding MarR family transcriptional regulator